MPNFSVEQKVASKFAGLTIGFVEGECTANSFSNSEEFTKQKTIVQTNARAITPLAEHPHIAAWRKAFKGFGADPTKTRSSAEAIIRRLQKGDSLPAINAIVDVYNLISARHVLPVGGQDAQNIVGSVTLRFAAAGETFLPLGASEPHKVDEGEVVYADERKILCSKWNYRDCEPAKISEATTKYVLFVDGAPGIERQKVEAAASDLAATLEKLVSSCKTSTKIVATNTAISEAIRNKQISDDFFATKKLVLMDLTEIELKKICQANDCLPQNREFDPLTQESKKIQLTYV